MKTNLMGLIDGITNEDYHAHSALSSSGLRELAKSPAHYLTYKNEPREGTKAMNFGTALHELVGEPQLFAKKYVKSKSFDRRTTEGKNGYAAFVKENEGKSILTEEEYDALDGMLYSILKNKTALHLLTNGKSEQSAFWRDPVTGVYCKCRPDYLREDGIIVDLKTTMDASPREFQRSISNFGYHIQSAFYLDGVSHVLNEPLEDFVHLVVEKKAPYGIAIYTLDEASLNKAREEIQKLLMLYAECSIKNEWPGYTSDIQNISLPNWMW